MATLTEIRNAFKGQLGAVRNITAYAIQPAKPNYPAAWVLPLRANYHADYDGSMSWVFAVTAAVSMTDQGQAQKALDDYVAPSGDKSVVAALESDPTLGDVVDSCKVLGLTNYGIQEIAGIAALTATWEVEVYA